MTANQKYADELPPGESRVQCASGELIDLRDHLGLAHQAAGRIWRKWGAQPRGGVTYAELFAVGVEGLWIAAQKFDSTRGCAFSTHAIWWVRNKVWRFTDNEACGAVRTPLYKLASLRKAGHQRPPRALSLDRVLSADDENATTFGDRLRDDDAVDPEQRAITADMRAVVAEILEDLPERHRAIFEGRLSDRFTLKELGAQFGLSRERSRQIFEECTAYVQAAVSGNFGAARRQRRVWAQAEAHARVLVHPRFVSVRLRRAEPEAAE